MLGNCRRCSMGSKKGGPHLRPLFGSTPPFPYFILPLPIFVWEGKKRGSDGRRFFLGLGGGGAGGSYVRRFLGVQPAGWRKEGGGNQFSGPGYEAVCTPPPPSPLPLSLAPGKEEKREGESKAKRGMEVSQGVGKGRGFVFFLLLSQSTCACILCRGRMKDGSGREKSAKMAWPGWWGCCTC